LSIEDSRGIGLLADRVLLARERLLSVAAEPIVPQSPPPFPWIVTGIGSSEAHARYLVSLANTHKIGSAVYWPTTAFTVGQIPEGVDTSSLIVMSQGFSANARIACSFAEKFKKCVLFTAATPEALAQSNKPEALALWRELELVGTDFVATPEPEEYTILIRTVGPLCGYAAILKWLSAFTGEYADALQGIPEVIEAVCNVPQATIAGLATSFLDGFEMNFVGSEQEYAQNLSYKRVEGIFGAQPIARELMQMAHGPFQQNFATAKDQWIFSADTLEQRGLVRRLLPMFERLGSKSFEIVSPAAAPLSIFFFEMLMDRVLLEAIGDVGYSQVDWPGKGLDGEGYQLSEPMVDL
jgi:hypothetical protein